MIAKVTKVEDKAFRDFGIIDSYKWRVVLIPKDSKEKQMVKAMMKAWPLGMSYPVEDNKVQGWVHITSLDKYMPAEASDKSVGMLPEDKVRIRFEDYVARHDRLEAELRDLEDQVHEKKHGWAELQERAKHSLNRVRSQAKEAREVKKRIKEAKKEKRLAKKEEKEKRRAERAAKRLEKEHRKKGKKK